MLLPEAQRRGEINFVLAKSLSYNQRLTFIVILLVVGLLIQLTGGVWVYVGAAFLLGATGLSVVRGYDNIPRKLRGGREWRGADRANFEKVIRLHKRSRRWDQSFIDVTCLRGAAALVLIVAGAGGVAYLLWLNDQDWLMRVWLADTAVLILPHWVTGVRRILKTAGLVIKIEHLLKIMDLWEDLKRNGEQMLPQMEVRCGKEGEMPLDAKLILRFEPLGEHFLGLQVQVSINTVQGHDYPYLYCVMVARKAFGLLEKAELKPPEGIVVEPKAQDDVEVIVIRQRTTKTSGYHTKPADCARIFLYALNETRRLVEAGQRHRVADA